MSINSVSRRLTRSGVDISMPAIFSSMTVTSSPVPRQMNSELERNPALFMRSSLLARILTVSDVYKLIIDLPGSIFDLGCWWGQNSVLFENLRSSYDWRDTPDADTTLVGKTFTEIIREHVVFVFDALPDWHRKDKINVGLSDGSTHTMSHQDCLRDLDRSIYGP